MYRSCLVIVSLLLFFVVCPFPVQAQEPDFEIIEEIIEVEWIEFDVEELSDVLVELSEYSDRADIIQLYINIGDWKLAIEEASAMAAEAEDQDIEFAAEGVKQALQGVLLDAQDSLFELESYAESNTQGDVQSAILESSFQIVELLEQGDVLSARASIDALTQRVWMYYGQDNVPTEVYDQIIEWLDDLNGSLALQVERPC